MMETAWSTHGTKLAFFINSPEFKFLRIFLLRPAFTFAAFPSPAAMPHV